MTESAPVNLTALERENAELRAALTVERERVTRLATEIEEASGWSKIVDDYGTDGFDALGDRWLRITAIVRMFNAIASVFSTWASEDIIVRFRESMTAIVHQAFVEGCITGVKAAQARAVLTNGANDDD